MYYFWNDCKEVTCMKYILWLELNLIIIILIIKGLTVTNTFTHFLFIDIIIILIFQCSSSNIQYILMTHLDRPKHD